MYKRIDQELSFHVKEDMLHYLWMEMGSTKEEARKLSVVYLGPATQTDAVRKDLFTLVVDHYPCPHSANMVEGT